MSLEVKALTGGYTQVPVIKDLSFTVNDGELMGLIGLNGAGKSTTINHIIGLLTPQKGSIILNGINLKDNPNDFKKQMAYVPEFPVLYEELTLREHIDLTIKAYDLDSERTWVEAKKLLKTFRLDKRLDWFPANFSKGMKQKVMIVCAFITQAKLFVIDEPFLGLDPLAVDDLLKLIDQKKKSGASILMSTHVLDTAEKYCDQFALLNNGVLESVGTVADFQTQFNQPGASLSEIYLKLARSEMNE
ncbi:ABC transporter ATP-binding protein [Pediococcus argentinicus]|uniref:ABC-type multidrug transport system, ATPase component n=1 Tax=Pediococcus argentinicus TaxID=480391 RepID=A0A0R2NIQ2_9LACO|nr:ABC transporter ATP-binding protein [Pediococcus argentinicus]KRO25678.1 ABC-type multidrug transport system, ATPase component [Pediococcus argentinicus]NKZ21985.1 ABC transporter ATP-binding protein [Pediococcus argentinicus]GEP19154.1 ABC transporter ATP-binding protein [Pediococcus argentinicus]